MSRKTIEQVIEKQDKVLEQFLKIIGNSHYVLVQIDDCNMGNQFRVTSNGDELWHPHKADLIEELEILIKTLKEAPDNTFKK